MNRRIMVIISALLLISSLVLVTLILQANYSNTVEPSNVEDTEVESGVDDSKAPQLKEPSQKMKDMELLADEEDKLDDEITDEEEVEEKETEQELGAERDKEIEYITKYVNVSSLNVRSGPGTDHKVTGVITINQEIDTSSEAVENGWVEVKTDRFSGFVNGSYLSDEKAEIKVVDVKDEKKEDSSKTASSTEETTNKNTKEVEPKLNDADKLKTIDGNNQLILVTSNGYGTSHARIQTFEKNENGTWDQILDIPGYIGKLGFATTMQEGGMKSPRGKYSIGTAFGRNGNPGTKLPFRNITPDDVWVDDPDSPLYNTWQSRKETEGQWSSAEDMDIPLYTYGFVINYNTNQVPGAGSAIFFHIANSYTAGCTGVTEANVISILRWLDPAKNPIIIQTPVSELGNY